MTYNFNPTEAKAGFSSTVKRIMSSKLLMLYIGFSLFYGVAQTGLSISAYLDADGPSQVIKPLLEAGNAYNASIAFVEDKRLVLCASSAAQQNFKCNVVWDGRTAATNKVSKPIVARDTSFNGGRFDIKAGVREAVVMNFDGTVLDLDKSCLWSLNWVYRELSNTKRESAAFLAFQAWVFFISIVGVTADSVPHVMASAITHFMVVGWSVFQITQSVSFERSFDRIITNGACAGASILPGLFDIRRRTDFPLLAVNVVAFFFSAFLTFRLVKLVNWQRFKTTGANLAMNRHRKFMLVLFTSLQLSFFFVCVYHGLLLDMLLNGNLAVMTSFVTLYKVSQITGVIILVPWILCGIYGVEREGKLPMGLFLGWCVVWISGFASTFFASSYIFEFRSWPFLAAMGIISSILVLITLVLGIACRINFGKGYLVGKTVSTGSPVDARAHSWGSGDIENSPYTEKLPASPWPVDSSIPQFPTTFEAPRQPPPAMNIPPRFFTPSTPSQSSLHGVSLTDNGARPPPSYRDSTGSFGNMNGYNQSSHSSPQNSFSTGPSFSSPPRRPPPPPGAVSPALNTATISGDLNGMFTRNASSGSSMYTGNGTPMYTGNGTPAGGSAVWGTAQEQGAAPMPTHSRSVAGMQQQSLAPQRAWSSKE